MSAIKLNRQAANVKLDKIKTGPGLGEIIYVRDRFSEDIDFSLLQPAKGFDLTDYTAFVKRKMEAFGFEVHVERVNKAVQTPIRFLENRYAKSVDHH